MRRARRLLAAALVLAALAPGARGEMAAAPSATEVLDAFGRIAFGDEHRADPDPRLAKWLRPIRVRLREFEPLNPGERAYLRRHMARLARLSGLDMREAAPDEPHNFAILLVPEHRYAGTVAVNLDPGRRHLLPRLLAANCLGLFDRHKQTHEILRATVIVPLDAVRAKGMAETCIAEETTQALGLPNDSDRVPNTLFNDTGRPRDLTRLDEALVRLLYHPRLVPGMRPAEAMAAARAVLPLPAMRR